MLGTLYERERTSVDVCQRQMKRCRRGGDACNVDAKCKTQNSLLPQVVQEEKVKAKVFNFPPVDTTLDGLDEARFTS